MQEAKKEVSGVLTFRPSKLTLVSLRVFPLVYVGTPYTKFHSGIQPAFEEASRFTARLQKNGIRAYSPIVHCHPVAFYGELNPLDHSLWLPFNETMMRLSNALVVGEMEGWKESDGVNSEIKVFARDGKPIYYVNPNSMAVRQ